MRQVTTRTVTVITHICDGPGCTAPAELKFRSRDLCFGCAIEYAREPGMTEKQALDNARFLAIDTYDPDPID